MSLFSYLRAMQETDLSWVLKVEEQVYDFPWSDRGFENSLDQGINYIFCDQQHRPLGYCCILPVLDEAHLLNICVAPSYQGQGVAKQGMMKVADALVSSGYQIMLLEVRESNESAQRLYGGMGFSKDGVRKNYYRALHWDSEVNDLVEGREDAILMSRALK